MRDAVNVNYKLFLYEENFVPKQKKNEKAMLFS